MSKRKVSIAVLILAAAIGYGAWRATRTGHDPHLISLSGNIELTEVDLSFKLPGRLVDLAVDEGQEVKAGQLIGRLDSNELAQQIVRDKAGVIAAQSALEQLKTSISFQEATIRDDIAAKRADLLAAEARLKELESGSRPQEIQSSRAALAEAEAQNRQAQSDWERAQRLFKNDDISASQHDQFRMRAEAAAAALKRAQEQAALVQEGPRKEQIEQQKAVVERARAAVRLAEANRIDLKRRQEEIGMRQAEIIRARAQTGVLDVQMNDKTLLSPVHGVVLSKSAEKGEVLAGGATVVTVGEIEKPWVRAYISERDLGRVKLGMRASVRTDSYPDKRYEGKVTFISSEAEFTPKQIQTQEERQKLVYRIKIEVPNPNGELKDNMPVDAEIRVN